MAVTTPTIGPNRAMRRGTHYTSRHITKKKSRGTILSGSWRGGAFGNGVPKSIPTIEA